MRRALVVSLALAATVAATTPATAGLGPQPVDTKDSYVPARAFEMSSSSAGTLYVTNAGTGIFGHVYFTPAPMTTGSSRVDLGERSAVNSDTASPSLVGSRVAVPQGAFGSETVSSVKTCTIGVCPTMSTFTVPAGWTYLGNADDRAVLFDPTTGSLGLAPWNGTAFTPIPLPEGYEPQIATGDTSGVLLHGNGTAVYMRRSDSTFFAGLDANAAVLTPAFVVWYLVATGPSFDQTAVRAVARSNPEAPATTLAMLDGAPDFNEIAANDTGVAWLKPDDSGDGTNDLYSLPMTGGTPVLYPRPIDSTALAPFEGGSNFLVNDRRAGIPGLYRVAPGSTGGTLTGLLPVAGAITTSMSVSNARAAYTDDMTEEQPVFLVDVPNGAPDYPTEVTVSPGSDSNVALSGPYVAFVRDGLLHRGRPGGTLATTAIPATDRGRVAISGRRALVTGGVNSRMVDVVTGAQTSLGHVYAALFGDYVVTLNYDTGELRRLNLATGAATIIRTAVAGCTTFCVDEEAWQLAPWGHEVAYAYRHGGSSPGMRSGRWNGNTGATTTLPGLGTAAEPAFYEFRYWDGLFLVYATDFTIDLYDLRGGSPSTAIEVEEFGDAPMGLDGHVVAWRRLSDLRGVVRPVTDLVPGHSASPRHLGANAPAGFGPGLARPQWTPSFLVSQDVSWTLTVRSGSAAGAVVRTLTGSSLHGEAVAVWDGLTDGGAAAPHGTYHWTLTGTGGGLPLQNVAGTASSVTGTVFLSRTALAAPVMNAPTRSTDTSATTTFNVSWSVPAGAPSGTTYTLQRSVNGGGYATVASGITGTTRAYAAPSPGTYRFRVQAVDPAGRASAFSTPDATMVPFDNTLGTYAGSWATVSSALHYRGSYRRASAAGATFTFTGTGTRFEVIGPKASSFGQFQVSVDGGAWSSLADAYSGTTRYRQVLYARNVTSGSHTIRVRVYGTSGRPYVGVDGVAFLR